VAINNVCIFITGSEFFHKLPLAVIAEHHPNRQIDKNITKNLNNEKIFLTNASFYFTDNTTFGYFLQRTS
jgi:hypothetical protein